MTGLTNSAGSGDPAPEQQLCGPIAAAGPELAPESYPDPEHESQPDPDAWRREVAVRLARYRTRRKPRAPRYPSLFLPFDSQDSRPWVSCVSASPVPTNSQPAKDDPSHLHANSPGSTLLDHRDDQRHAELEANRSEGWVEPQPRPGPEVAAKIIEFPRSAAIPEVHSNTLADPIFDRPRIVEAPEVVPPAPALGGILIDAIQPEAADRSARGESLIVPAPIPRRLLAAATDVSILLGAISAFTAVFLHFNPITQFGSIRESLSLLGGFVGALIVLFWVTYQLLFLGSIGSTPGLLAAGVKLTRFDGSPVARRTRCWRVLASFLSALSAGLGYLWCFLDQDSLCWHDRITRTYFQSVRNEH